MERKLYSLRGGLGKARKARGMTQVDLAAAMDVSLKTVMNWEQGIVNPDFEKAIKLTRILDCDLDYLIGRLEESTHDIHFVHEFTGLSEEAIRKISCPELNHPISKILSHMIESDAFENLATTYRIFLEFLGKLTEDDIEDQLHGFELKEDSVVLGTNQAINHFKQEVALSMTRICEHDQYSQLMRMEERTAGRWKDVASVQKEIRYIEREIGELTEQKQFLEEEVLPDLRKGKE